MYVWLCFIFIYTVTYGLTDIAHCNSNKCYHDVNTSHSDLLNLINQFNSTVSQARIPKIYDLRYIKEDIAEVGKIKNKIDKIKTALQNTSENVNRENRTVSDNQKTVDRMFDQLLNLSYYNSTASKIYREANKHKRNFEKSFEIGENASATCQQARNKYLKLKLIIDEIVSDYENLNQNYSDLNQNVSQINKEIENTFQKTIDTKNNFDQLKLPIRFTGVKNFSHSAALLKENIDLLKDLLKASQMKWNNQINSKNITRLQNDVNQMMKNLTYYKDLLNKTDTFEPTVDSTSRKLLEDIKKKLNQLETKFKSINFSAEEKELLLNSSQDDERQLEEIKEKRILIKNYNMVLDAMPIDDEKLITKIRNEISNLKTTVSLVEKWQNVKKKLEKLKANRNEIVNIDCNAKSGLTS